MRCRRGWCGSRARGRGRASTHSSPDTSSKSSFRLKIVVDRSIKQPSNKRPATCSCCSGERPRAANAIPASIFMANALDNQGSLETPRLLKYWTVSLISGFFWIFPGSSDFFRLFPNASRLHKVVPLPVPLTSGFFPIFRLFCEFFSHLFWMRPAITKLLPFLFRSFPDFYDFFRFVPDASRRHKIVPLHVPLISGLGFSDFFRLVADACCRRKIDQASCC